MAEHYALLSAIISDAAFWVGLTTVAVFAAGRFNERRVDTEKDLDPPLTAHCFTTRFRFNSALVMYVLVYCGFYGALIFGFSFEVFQNFFKEFFGPITLPGEGMEFGTPAWVATLVPILVSTTPWFRQRDELFRRWLWAFSGVPQTAQAFANELVSVAAQRLPPMRPDHLEPLRLSDSFAVYEVLRLIENRLRERFDDYKDFLYQHGAVSRSLPDTHEALRHSVASDADHAAQCQELPQARQGSRSWVRGIHASSSRFNMRSAPLIPSSSPTGAVWGQPSSGASSRLTKEKGVRIPIRRSAAGPPACGAGPPRRRAFPSPGTHPAGTRARAPRR